MDRAYTDYRGSKTRNNQGIFLVTRLKRKADDQVIKRQAVIPRQDLTSDPVICL